MDYRSLSYALAPCGYTISFEAVVTACVSGSRGIVPLKYNGEVEKPQRGAYLLLT